MQNKDLTNASVFKRNTLWNLLGYGIPLAVALVAIPFLIKGLGTDRFGLLTLAWVFIGYLSLLDMGLGRALTKVVSGKLGSGESEGIPDLIWTALIIMVAIGILITTAIYPFIPWVMASILKIPPYLLKESIDAYHLLTLCIPIVILSVGFRGILEAYQRFDLINSLRIPLGIYSFCAPLLIIPYTKSIQWVIAVIILGRIFGAIVQFFFCCRIVKRFLNSIQINKSLVPYLLKFGGWMSITNIVSPILMYIDRYFIGALLSLSVVAYYATPSEAVTKLWFVSGSLISVLFPVISATFENDRQTALELMEQSIKYIYLTIFPIVFLIVIFAREGLTLWVGPEFAQNSYKVLQWLAAGVFVHSLSQIPYSFIQGAGRPDLTAKLHLIELPFYLVLLWLFVSSYGILGAAIIWFIRITVDMLGMYFLLGLLVGNNMLDMKFKLAIIGMTLLVFLFISMHHLLVIKVTLAIIVLSVFGFLSYHFFNNEYKAR